VTITACFVTRNHETVLPDAIDAARAAASAVVVADTGSTDRTCEVAAEKGALVVRVDWSDDFAPACNAALDAVTTEWVLWLNPDERVVPGGWPDLRGLTPGLRAIAYRVRVRHEMAGRVAAHCPFDVQVRLFRAIPSLRFVGRLHPRFSTAVEDVARAEDAVVETCDALIRRLAHLSSVTPDKIRWTNRLIEAELRDRPDQLGLRIEWGRNLLSLGDTRGHDVLADAAESVMASPVRPGDAATVGPLFEYLLTNEDTPARKSRPIEDIRSQVRARCPFSPPVLWALAGERFRAGDFGAAAADLRTLLALGASGRATGAFDPDIVGPAAAVNFAICLVRGNRPAEAAAVLRPLLGDPRWARDASEVMAAVAAQSVRPATPVVPDSPTE
jgi:hypothetical protein